MKLDSVAHFDIESITEISATNPKQVKKTIDVECECSMWRLANGFSPALAASILL